jgi:hypothetical protein
MKTANMFWDSTGTSWEHFGVPSQPAALLIDTDGKVVGSWTGFLDTKKVQAALDKLG